MTTSVQFVPFGEADRGMVEQIAVETAAVFAAAHQVSAGRLPLPQEAYDPQRRQFSASGLLARLRHDATAGHGPVLGIADVDLFAPGLNFVFGEAELNGKVAVMSVARLRPEFWGEAADVELLLARSVKEAVHELGHVVGLRHCSSSDCVMHFSNRLADTDRKCARFCSQCAESLGWGLRGC
jgi:archaemetzincin